MKHLTQQARPLGKSRAGAHQKPSTIKRRDRSQKTSKLQRLALFNGTPLREMARSLSRALLAKGLVNPNGRATKAGKEVVARMKRRSRRRAARRKAAA